MHKSSAIAHTRKTFKPIEDEEDDIIMMEETSDDNSEISSISSDEDDDNFNMDSDDKPEDTEDADTALVVSKPVDTDTFAKAQQAEIFKQIVACDDDKDKLIHLLSKLTESSLQYIQHLKANSESVQH